MSDGPQGKTYMDSDLSVLRKSHHLSFAEKAQTDVSLLNTMFDYEPLLSGFPTEKIIECPIKVGQKTLSHPLWISSMTGGTGEAGAINICLAKIAGEFGLGLGLGSCRPLLESDEYFEDFNLRPLMGEKGVLYANLGMAQVSNELQKDGGVRIVEILKRLQCDGMFLHINPLQEWYQPEGDRWYHSPLKVIDQLSELFQKSSFTLGVKEVGQGLGPKSLEALIQGPAEVIEFAAFGGTNFSQLEILRGEENAINSDGYGANFKASDLTSVGHSASEMVLHVNRLMEENRPLKDNKTFIVSGGIRSFLHGFYLLENLQATGAYGMAKPFLVAAQKGEDSLRHFVRAELEGLTMARTFLKAKPLAQSFERGLNE